MFLLACSHDAVKTLRVKAAAITHTSCLLGSELKHTEACLFSHTHSFTHSYTQMHTQWYGLCSFPVKRYWRTPFVEEDVNMQLYQMYCDYLKKRLVVLIFLFFFVFHMNVFFVEVDGVEKLKYLEDILREFDEKVKFSKWYLLYRIYIGNLKITLLFPN